MPEILPIAPIAQVPIAQVPIAEVPAPESQPAQPVAEQPAPAPVPATATAPARTLHIDPTAAPGGDGSLERPFNSWLSVQWEPDTAYLQKAGTEYAGSFVVGVAATADAPVLMGTYGGDAPTIIKGSVVFTGAAHVTLQGFTVQDANLAGVAITNGSQHITITGNTLQNNGSGVWVGETAGGANAIVGNSIIGNATNGVSFDKVRAGEGIENRLEGNVIADNGWHGVFVHANHTQVLDNTISGNGQTLAGGWGIQVYANSLEEGLGRFNLISGNVPANDTDQGGNDGSGILLDQYTAFNTVENNLAYRNDGAGIEVFASSDNPIPGDVEVAPAPQPEPEPTSDASPVSEPAPAPEQAPAPAPVAEQPAPENQPAPPVAQQPAPAPVPATAIAPARTLHIDPTAAPGGDGSLERPLNSWLSVQWEPDTAYLQKAGTEYAGSFVVGVAATADAPVLMGTYGGDAPTIIKGSVVFTGAAHVTLQGFTVQDSSLAGVAITNGSQHITITGNTLQNNASGVWVGETAGGSNAIVGNSIIGNAGNGVGLDKVRAGEGIENRVEGNVIADNGWHGVQLYANHTQVLDNTISGNGQTLSGCSGIQVYANSLAEGLGRFNLISGNVTFDNTDRGGNDGIGILLDHYTAFNTVENNLAYRNDGAGIAVFASSDNLIRGNTAFDNMQDSGGTHTLRAEIALNTDQKRGLDLASGNVFEGNIGLPQQAGILAVYVDPESAGNGNRFDGNTWYNGQDGNLFIWSSTVGRDIEVWNGLASVGTGEDFAVAPVLASAPEGEFEHLFDSAPVLTLNGESVRIAGWDSTGGLVSDWML